MGIDDSLNKFTFPALLGLEEAKQALLHTYETAKNALTQAKLPTNHLASLADYVVQRTY